MMGGTPPPMEYDPASGVIRANGSASAPSTLLGVLVIALVVFGFVEHTLWIVAGVLIAVLVAVHLVRRRFRRTAAQATREPR